MTGPELRQLREAIVSAFPSPHSLKVAVDLELDTSLDQITSGTGPYTAVVYDLLRWAEAHGTTGRLIRALVDQNAGNPELRKAAEQMNLLGGKPDPDVGRPPVEASDKPATFMDWESWYARRAAFELTVGRVYAAGRSDPIATGLLVARGVVLTCGPVGSATYVKFCADVDDRGRPTGHVDVPVTGFEFPQSDPKRCVLLVVAGSPGDDQVTGPVPQARGWLFLDGHRTAAAGDGTYLLRHSDEGRLQFGYLGDSVEAADGHPFRHRHDARALPGSPIVTKDWAPVALHTGADPTGKGIGISIGQVLTDLTFEKGNNLDITSPFGGA
jgi:hypothetical protein